MLLDMYEQEFSEPSQMRKKMQLAYANSYISSSKDIALSKENNKFLGKMEKGHAGPLARLRGQLVCDQILNL